MARGKSGHHQKLDLERHPEKAQATHRKLRAKDRPLVDDFISDEAFEALLLAWFSNAARVLRPGGSFYVWGGYANLGNYPLALKAAGLYFSQAIIWDKEHPVLTRKDLMGAHEWALYGWKEGAAHRFFGPSNATDLWHVKKVSPNKMVHLTEKPVELARRAVEYSSLSGEAVLDPFAGSGSTRPRRPEMPRPDSSARTVRPDDADVHARVRPAGVGGEHAVGPQDCRSRQHEGVRQAERSAVARSQGRGLAGDVTRGRLDGRRQCIDEGVDGGGRVLTVALRADHDLRVGRRRQRQLVATVERFVQCLTGDPVVRVVRIEDGDDDPGVEDGQAHSSRSSSNSPGA